MKLTEQLIISGTTYLKFEVTPKEISDKGFDHIWDELRDGFSASKYEIDNIKFNLDGRLVIKLKSKREQPYLSN